MSYSDAESLQGDRVKLYLSWAGSCKQTYSYKDAVDKYEKAAEIQPLGAEDQISKVECLFQLGEQLWDAGRYGDAAAAYKQCNDEDNQGPLAEAAWTNYIDMTVSSRVLAAPPSKDPAAAGRTELRISNNTNEDFTLYMSGPSSGSYYVPALQSQAIYIVPGYYNMVYSVGSRWEFPNANVEFTRLSSSGYYGVGIEYQ